MIQRMYKVAIHPEGNAFTIFERVRYFTSKDIAFGFVTNLLKENGTELKEVSIWVQEIEVPGKDGKAASIVREREIATANERTKKKLNYHAQQYVVMFYKYFPEYNGYSDCGGISFPTHKEALSFAFKKMYQADTSLVKPGFIELYKSNYEYTDDLTYLMGTDNLYDIIETMKEENV